MLYFSYKIGPFFAFLHVKCAEIFKSFTKAVSHLSNPAILSPFFCQNAVVLALSYQNMF